MTDSRSVTEALVTFVDHYEKSHDTLAIEHDPAWPSPCELGEPYEENGRLLTRWHPVRRHQAADDFASIERALEVTVHPDVRDYYAAFWSAGLEAEAPDGHVSLLQLWSPADGERLVENVVGHALAQRRAKAPFSIFFACTEEDSELFLSVDNETGQVVLEAPGKQPLRTIAASLCEFIDTLVPAPDE